MTTYTWSHPSGSAILDSFEIDEPFSIDVTVSAKSTESTSTSGDGSTTTTTTTATPSSLTVTMHDLPDLIDFVEDGTTVTFSAPTRLGLFPIEIDYLLNRSPSSIETITGWDELPPLSKEIVRYEAPQTDTREYTITLTATGSSGSETITVYIIIRYSFNLGRDTLKSELSKRSFTPIISV